MGDSTWDDLSNMSGVTSYEELSDRFKAAFDRIKRADASFPESVLQEFPLVLSGLEVDRIAVSQGWMDEFLRPAAPPVAAPSRNIQDFIRRQPQQVAVATPARAAPPPVPQAPPASIGRPSIASPAAESAKAAPPAPPAPLPAQPAAPAAPMPLPAALAPLPAAPVPAEIPAPPVPAEGEGVPADDDDDNALVCAICQDVIRAGDRVRKLNCPHSFHDECMEGWFRVTRDYTLRCPMRCAQ